MRRNFGKLGLVVSLSAIALLSACGPKASETAQAPAATAPAAEAPAATTNAVAEVPAAAPTNAVAEAPATAAAPAAGAVVLAIKDAAGIDMSGDPTKGAAVFRQCQTCHVKEIGVNKVGPSLAGVVGRPAGSIAGFRYSEANKGSGVVWSEQTLYTYLEDPKKFMPGTNMAFVGIKDSQKRADVIAYLKSPT